MRLCKSQRWQAAWTQSLPYRALPPLAAEALLRWLPVQELDGAPWIVYPWDAPDIEQHNRLGQAGTQ